MKAVERWISRLCALLASLVVLAMMLQVVIDVAMRKILGAGFPATGDIVGRYYMVAVSFLPLAMTEIGQRHIAATIFTDRLSGRARQAVQALALGLGLAVFGLLTWGSGIEALSQTGRGAYIEAGMVRLATWPSYWIPVVSFLLMTAVLVLRVAELVQGTYRDDAHDPLSEVDSHLGEVR